MPDRMIAVVLMDERRAKDAEKAAEELISQGVCGKVTIFSERRIDGLGGSFERGICENREFPAAKIPGRETSIRNAIVSEYEGTGFRGFLHVLSDGLLVRAGASKFVSDLEQMMRVFDYPLWLSTVTDPCNYVYAKYNPRFVMANDMPELAAAGVSCDIAFTSHSNTGWMAYDLAALQAQKDIEYFCEEFTVPMFYIIELLARRKERGRPGQLFFMNQYMTVTSEAGAFASLPALPPSDGQPSDEIMRAEDALFKSMNVKYQSDSNLDAVIDRFLEKTIEKSGFEKAFPETK